MCIGLNLVRFFRFKNRNMFDICLNIAFNLKAWYCVTQRHEVIDWLSATPVIKSHTILNFTYRSPVLPTSKVEESPVLRKSIWWPRMEDGDLGCVSFLQSRKSFILKWTTYTCLPCHCSWWLNFYRQLLAQRCSQAIKFSGAYITECQLPQLFDMYTLKCDNLENPECLNAMMKR